MSNMVDLAIAQHKTLSPQEWLDWIADHITSFDKTDIFTLLEYAVEHHDYTMEHADKTLANFI